MTTGKFIKILEENNIPADVTMMSDSGWEMDASHMDGVFYNETKCTLVFTQGGDKYDEHYFNKDGWKLLYSGDKNVRAKFGIHE